MTASEAKTFFFSFIGITSFLFFFLNYSFNFVAREKTAGRRSVTRKEA